MISFVGAVSYGLFNFLTVVLVAHALSKEEAGAFFEVVAMFMIVVSVLLFGAEGGLVRQISRARALNRVHEIRRIVVAASLPVMGAGTVGVIVGIVGARRFATTFADPSTVADLRFMIAVASPFVLLAAVMYLSLAITRGLGTMVPTVAVERIGRVGLQTLGMTVVLVAGLSGRTAALIWAAPFGLAAIWGGLWSGRLIRGRERKAEGALMPRRLGLVSGEFWRFSAPRGLASVFQTGSLWLDTLFLGAMNSPGSAAVYTAGGRLTLIGSFFLQSIVQAMSPQVSALLARGETRRVEHVYRTATWSLVALTWPIYLLLIAFAPGVLRLFGKGYGAGVPAIVIMSGAMLVSMAFGPVDIVLLMGGKSSLNLWNTLASLGTNIVLNLLLIPHLGISGAAIAWAASTVVNNVLPALQVHHIFKIHAFGLQFLIPLASSTVFVGGAAFAGRTLFGSSIPVMVGAGGLGCLLHAGALWRFRETLRLTELKSAFTRRGAEVEGSAP